MNNILYWNEIFKFNATLCKINNLSPKNFGVLRAKYSDIWSVNITDIRISDKPSPKRILESYFYNIFFKISGNYE